MTTITLPEGAPEEVVTHALVRDVDLVAFGLQLVQERPERANFRLEHDDLDIASARADETIVRLDGASERHGEGMCCRAIGARKREAVGVK